MSNQEYYLYKAIENKEDNCFCQNLLEGEEADCAGGTPDCVGCARLLESIRGKVKTGTEEKVKK